MLEAGPVARQIGLGRLQGQQKKKQASQGKELEKRENVLYDSNCIEQKAPPLKPTTITEQKNIRNNHTIFFSRCYSVSVILQEVIER